MLFVTRYSKRQDGKIWNRKDLLGQIAITTGKQYKLKGTDTLIFYSTENSSLVLKFISSNYADSDRVELNASIFFKHGNKEFEWLDLFHFTKMYHASKKYRPLSIHKDEAWEGCNIQKDTINIYASFVEVALSKVALGKFLRGERVKVGDRTLELPPSQTDKQYVYEYSKKIAEEL